MTNAGLGPIAAYFVALLVGVLAALITFVEFDPASQVLAVPDRLLTYFVTIWRAFAYVFLFEGWKLAGAMLIVGGPLSYFVYRLTGSSNLRTVVAVACGAALAYVMALFALYLASRNPLNTDACRAVDCMRQAARYYVPAGAIAGLVFARAAYGRWWGLAPVETATGRGQ